MAQRAPVASHLVVSSCRPVYWLNRCSFLSCIFRLLMDPPVILMSLAYPWSSYVMIEAVDLCGWYDGRYPLLPMASHRNKGSMKIVKRKMIQPIKGEKEIEKKDQKSHLLGDEYKNIAMNLFVKHENTFLTHINWMLRSTPRSRNISLAAG